MKTAAACLAALLCTATAACMPTPPAQSVATATSAAQFVTLASVSNAFEIETSQLALERASRQDVRRFANRMIRDHTMAARRLDAIVARQGMTPPPPALDARHAAMLEKLRATPPEGFDAAYMTMQAQAHEEAITLFSAYASNGDDPMLRSFAQRTLPVLQMHARMVQDISSSAHAM